MAVAWAALGLLALVSFSFIGIVWNKIDKLGSDLRQEIGRLDGKIDKLGSDLGQEIMAQSIRIDGLAVAEGQHPANA